MKTHICLVSAQPIPNLIPLRMQEFRPDRVVLLVSPDMQAQSERLKRVMAPWGISVEVQPIAPYDLESARETCLALLGEMEGDEVTLNVTGGTKLMALASFEVFREFKRPIIYVDTQDRMLKVLSPAAQARGFEGVIKVRDYLAAYGQNVTSCEAITHDVMTRHRQIYGPLVKEFHHFETAITALNDIARKALDKNVFPCKVPLETKSFSWQALMDLLGLLAANGVLSIKNGDVAFSSRSDAEFSGGKWLEEYVFDEVSALGPTDVCLGAQVEWDHGGRKPTKNEYDVLFTYANQLFMIECKTKRREGAGENATNADTAYKLDSLIDAAGGLYGRGMLVSYQRIPDHLKTRLSASGLKYCDGSDLHRLKEIIKKWIGG